MAANNRTQIKEDKMKGIIGFVGFILLLGGAGNSDCGRALLPSVSVSLIGLAIMYFASKGGKTNA